MFIIYLCTKLPTPGSNGSHVTINEQKAKYRLHAADMLFYILQRMSLTKVECVLEIYNHRKF